jgi:hypothetical protein
MDAALADPVGPSAGSASNGFIVSKALLVLSRDGIFTASAESEVIAAALAGGTGVECAENDIGNALGGEDVAANDGEAVTRSQNGAFRDDNLDGC